MDKKKVEKIPSRVPLITWRKFEPWVIECPVLAITIIEDLQQLVDTHGKEVRIRLDAGANYVSIEYGVTIGNCVFCASNVLNTVEYVGFDKTPIKYGVLCEVCGCIGPLSLTESAAIIAWNKGTLKHHASTEEKTTTDSSSTSSGQS